ncbi:M13 family metallopeptidase [Luteimonas sp. SJ-92]|uniref:M13 family metallopeptidase n=1 Tax=Luteimonas salinisoli TaxID=2752307 RepID=A0A853JH90_9GAMM|nr:M13 family metallopeptidase [Luteimonas salinisoli]NZA28092.1 M13 family metallopeptidase [Luteimonas salinisoli]
MPHARPLAFALAACLALGLPIDADAQRRAARAPAGPTECTDFYSTVNKDWLAANMVIGSGSVSALGELQALALQQQRDLLDAAMRSPQNHVQQLLGDFWASGLDEAAVEADGAQPIAPLLARIDGIRRARDVPPAIAALHQVGIPVAFNFNADVDLADLSRHIGYFSQGGLGLPDPAYYTRDDADTQAIFGRYRDYVRSILALTGTAEKTLDEDTAAVIDLETRIARHWRAITLARDPRANYAPVPTAGFDRQYKRLQLDEFLKTLAIDGDTVSMANPDLFAALDELVGSVKPAQWKAYLRFHIGDAMAPYLSRTFREAEFEFHGRVLRGQAEPLPRQTQVLDAINKAAGPMLGREYVARHLPDGSRMRATTIATEVRDALLRGIERSAWLSEPGKAEARAKLEAMRIEIGAPERDIDYSVQPMGRGSFGGNMLIASTWRHREEMRRIGQHNADQRWEVLPQQPALAYDLAHNRLIVSAAVLQPPVLDMAQDAAAHYGSYGALVGHELGRSVDVRGRLVDAGGNVRTWWSETDQAAWNDLANRLAGQYNGYAWPAGTALMVDGTRTRDENAADLAGVELAWDALQTATPELPAESAKSFFRAWAQLWRQQMSADVASRLAAGEHPPGQWRTNGPLANLPAFGGAFDCKAGTAMQRGEDEQVRIWR